MPKVLYAAFAAIGCAALAGCGGGGGGSQPEPPNPFAGYYGGPGTSGNSSDSLVSRIGVGANGQLCGAIIDRTANTRTLLGALVSSTGDLSRGSVQTYDANGTPTVTGTLSGSLTVTGPAQAGSKQLGAILTITTASGSVTYTFEKLTVAHYRASAKKK